MDQEPFLIICAKANQLKKYCKGCLVIFMVLRLVIISVMLVLALLALQLWEKLLKIRLTKIYLNNDFERI
ncbi:MAG: hypothetical protein D8H97_05260 [Neisseria sp.]|nr:MAG: hypothetical protein D8H97_05260 [Neisseria sp.]